MSLFLKKIFLFSLALSLSILLAVFFAVRIGKRSGELLKLDEMIEIQQRDAVLVITGIQNTIPFLKYKTANILNPDILAMGTSRIHSVRQEHFVNGVNFYNTAIATQNLPSYYDFIENLDVIPRFIIFNLDQWQFNENYFNTDFQQLMKNRLDYKNGYEKVNIIRGILRMIVNLEVKIEQKFDYPENLGLIAAVYGEGFRKDGAYYWKRVLDSDDYKSD
jgi:hypothetical protein